MEVKKSPKANLENKKMFYRELGLIIALGVIPSSSRRKRHQLK